MQELVDSISHYNIHCHNEMAVELLWSSAIYLSYVVRRREHNQVRIVSESTVRQALDAFEDWKGSVNWRADPPTDGQECRNCEDRDELIRIIRTERDIYKKCSEKQSEQSYNLRRELECMDRLYTRINELEKL